MRKTTVAYGAFLLCISPSLPAAGPPNSGTQTPQISYVRSSRGYDLIVANNDGSGARTIYSSSRMLAGELGPDGMIYFWEGGRFNRMPATGGTVQSLFDTSGTIVRHSDLSRDGTSVAWFSPEGVLFRYDIGTGSQTPLVSVANIIDLTFDYTGNSIIYAQAVSDVDYELKSISAAGGNPISLGLVARISNFDSARRDDTLALTINPPGASPYIGLWKPGMGTPTRIADGYNPTYRCDDSSILFDRMTNSGPALYNRTSNGGITLVAKPPAIFPSYKPVC